MTNKTADTLIKDIHKLLREVASGKGTEIPPEKLGEFGANVAMKLSEALKGRGTRTRPPKTLYMSEIGKPCRRQLWYEVNKSSNNFDQDKLQPSTLIKFLYGDILEELVLMLCEAAGHDVTDRQKSITMNLPNGWQLRGKMDARIDGEIVDVKSASTQSFQKFVKGINRLNDPFGYISQLQSYNIAEDVTPGEPTSFIAIDKQNGTLVRDEHKVDVQIMSKKELTELTNDMEKIAPPPRKFDAQVTSHQNECLGVECSYCAWKYECWKDANGGKGIRTFLYSSRKPVHLVKIKVVPDVQELTRDKEAEQEEI